jgi:Uma2 family endonuclease
MASLPKSTRVTYEEWLRMPIVEDAIEEVVNGEIRIMPANKLIHALIVQKLFKPFAAQLDESKYLVLITSFGLIIRESPFTCRVPDLAVFERGTIVEVDGYIHSAPQLAVEVLSPAKTRREREEKLDDYAEIGVPEVWVFSPEARNVEILLLENGRLRRSAILAEGLLKPVRFPNVQINIAEIWPD